MDNFGNRIYAILPPENDEGCIEYKWNLAKMNHNKCNKLVSQMRWRVCQDPNNYSALYILGIHDGGQLTGLSKNKIIATYLNLLTCANTANLYMCMRKLLQIENTGKYWAILQIFHNKKKYHTQSDLDLPTIPKHKLPSFINLRDLA